MIGRSESEGERRERKPRCWVSFGMNGHEKEYVFAMDSDEIPADIASALQEELGQDWEVMDRGSRIEIHHRKEFGIRDDEKINTALQKALSGRYDFTPAK